MTTEIKKPPPPISNAVRNMIIGVITAVLVSGTVYLLGFGKKSGSTKLERKKATTEAWKSYVTIENIYAKNTALLLRDAAQFQTYKELYQEFMKESDRFITGLQGLITAEDVDKDMVAVLKRRAENEKNSNPRVEKMYLGFDELVDTGIAMGWTEQQFSDSIIARSTVFQKQTQGMLDRALTEIEFLSKTLSERYDQPFNTDDFFIIQVVKYKKDMFSLLANEKIDSTLTENITKEYLAGKWDASGATITLHENETWTWYVPADSSQANGTWEFKKGQLIMNVEKHPKLTGKGVWGFNLSAVTDTSFVMHLSKEPYNFYTLIRK